MDIIIASVNKLHPNDLTWILSFLTLWSMYLAGEMKLKAWKIGLVNQAMWVVYIAWSNQKGLIPMNIGMWYMCLRNYFLWKGTTNVWAQAIFVHPKESFKGLFNFNAVKDIDPETKEFEPTVDNVQQ